MKKVGIITICDYSNYGNRLQNFATQEVLKSLGCQVETIKNAPPLKSEGPEQTSKFNKIKGMSVKELFNIIIAKIKYEINIIKNQKYLDKKIEAFKQFSIENINETNFVIKNNNIPSNLEVEYDFFVVGSDQVWNPIFRNGFSVDFLTFAPNNKRIAYAPSFGISSIPDKFVDNYKLWLSEMEYISVREQAGAEIIKKLTGRDAVVLVDPTLMLPKEKWLSISKPATTKSKGNYLLTYFLGDISKEKKKIIKTIASEKNLEIVNLASLEDKSRYSSDPAEFIDYIYSSSIFLTDSFHGCVFSILLEKPFIVFEREGKIPSMNSRIDTLLTKFQLETRKWDNLKKSSNMFKVDYSHVPTILDFEREKAINYLKEALNI